MTLDTFPIATDATHTIQPQHIASVEAFDLALLTYMADRVQEIMPLFAAHRFLTAPLISHVNEENERSHRIVLYARPPQVMQDLYFVGFMSGKTASIQNDIVQNLTTIDRNLVMELARQPGLLSYSSLQLPNEDWANFVVFTQIEAKENILTTHMHQRAAYELAPSYYSWIRLHHGIVPGGRFQNGLRLRTTRYYSFIAGQAKPQIEVKVYDPELSIDSQQ